MTVIPANQYQQFWRSLPTAQQDLAQLYFGKVLRDLRHLTVTVELLDGQGGSTVYEGYESPPYAVRLTAAEIGGEAIVTTDFVRSTLELGQTLK